MINHLYDYKTRAVNKYYRYNTFALNGDEKPQPKMKFFDYEDEISEQEYQDEIVLIQNLRNPEIELSSIHEVLEFVHREVLLNPNQNPAKEDIKKAKEHIDNLSAQQYEEFRLSFLRMEEDALSEMEEVRRWQTKFDYLASVYSIPDGETLEKIVRYENSLERSIFRNLAALKTLQDQRLKSHSSGSKMKYPDALDE